MTVNGVEVTQSKAPAEVLFSLEDWPNDYPASSVTAINWSFGDGLFSTLFSPTHIYGMQGKYNVSCQITFNYSGTLISHTVTATFYATRQINVASLDKCYRVGFYESQGFGPSEFSGDYWPRFPVGIGGDMCYDENEQPHHIVFDEQYGVFYEISEPNGPAGSDLVKKWTDDDATGAEHEIESEISLAEITGDRQHFQVEHNETHLYFKPFNEDTRGATGYDAYGYRGAQQVDVDWYMNGEQVTPNGQALNIPKIGEIVSDRKLYGQRGRSVVKMAAAEYVMTGYDQYWVEKDQAIDISETPNSESDCQAHLANLDMWITRGGSSALFDRVTGVVQAGTAIVGYGADGKSNSGIAIIAPVSLATSFVFGDSGYVAFFYSGIIASMGFNFPAIVDHPAGAFTAGGISWKLGYMGVPGGISASGPLIITPTGTLRLFDLRISQSFIPSVADLLYLYNDVRYNNADNVCPIW